MIFFYNIFNSVKAAPNNYPQNNQPQIIYVPYFVPIYFPYYPCFGQNSGNNGNPSVSDVTTTTVSPEYSFDIRKTP